MNVNRTKLNLCIKNLNSKLKDGYIDQKEYKELVNMFTVYYLSGGVV